MDQPDDGLAELLELADGERPLPRGLEDRLLRAVIDTAAQTRRDPAAQPKESSVVPLLEPGLAAQTGGQRRAPLLVAAACIVLLVGGLLTIARDEPTQPVADRAPSNTVAAFDPAALDDAAACDALAQAIERSGLIGPSVVVADLDPAQLRLVSVLADDLERRRTLVDAETLMQLNDDVLVPLDFAATQLEADRVDAAVSAHRRAVGEFSELRQRWPNAPCL